MKTNKLIIIITCLLVTGNCSLVTAQKQVRKDLRTGNKAYKQEKYTDAEIDYRRAIEKNARSSEAAYNLGNALLRQNKAQEAVEQYQIAIKNETGGTNPSKNNIAMAWHNTGNVFLSTAVSKKDTPPDTEALKKSIEAYKNALRNNPHDDETRYNLALAQQLLKNQEGNGGGGNDDQNKDDQKKDDQKQDDQKQDQKDNKDQEKKPDEKPQEQQQNKNEMSKQNADQILDVMMQNEKETQEKVKEQQMKQQKQRKTEKNW
ncbi:MAG: tetratricopeptide repeat protein [Candidatus Symbiothrix sp.]|jgi:tetratricopeptide (TPR) repeat protein|nr:tetratricopeptide repeat protein [Candidatus Symbiothrix sp.]